MTVMTSDRKAASNRKNAQKSTGPRSELGRLHSRRNALRHGLSIAIGSDPSFSEDINVLANALAIDRGEHEDVGEFARQAAEAEIDLLRIRKLRTSLFDAFGGKPELKLDDHTELNDSLAKLERYERRAFSRRKSAIRAMIQD
jgi:hypothetical protein